MSNPNAEYGKNEELPCVDGCPACREKGVVAKTPDETFVEKAKKKVFDYVKARLEKTDTHVTFSEDDVYDVWSCYILGHWKALVSTTLPDGMYYEVTYNSEKHETYLDAYKKFDNVMIPD